MRRAALTPSPSAGRIWLALAASHLVAAIMVAPSPAAAQVEGDEEEGQTLVEDQDPEADAAVETGEAQDAEATAIQEGGYEPDQRGFDEAGGAGGADTGGDAEEGSDEPPSIQLSGSTSVVRMESDDGYGGSDGGGFLGFELSLFGGASLIGIDAIDGDNAARVHQRGSIGGSFGFSGALRIGPVSVGPRVGFAVDAGLTLGTIGFDVTVALLEGRIQPTLRASLSYAFLASVSDPLPSQRETSTDGVHAELAAGVRWRFANPWMVGAELAGGVLHLERGAVPACEAPCSDEALDLARPGAANGLTLRLHVFVGVGF